MWSGTPRRMGHGPINTNNRLCIACGAAPGNPHGCGVLVQPRTTNAGPWADWIEAIDPAERERIFALAERILPNLVYQAHSRNSGHFGDEQDDAAISTALRIAQRFYARIGAYGSEPLGALGVTQSPLHRLYDRYLFLCESGDGWWLFGDCLEDQRWEGVTEPSLLKLRKEGKRIWYLRDGEQRRALVAKFSSQCFAAWAEIAAREGWNAP